ncbi:MAG: VacJ family lipoprotein [Aliarcobacter sp.]|nr:VacJ family lipoprotein [Aliarcobacter sp.]
MKNFIIILLLVNFSFANNDLTEDFDSEFSTKKEEIFDPLSGYNRLMTTFNDKVFMNILNPISKGYAYVVPQTARIGIDNFFENIMFPVRFTNNLLQLKFQNSGEELGRFLINTLWGLGGFMDPATKELNMKAHKEDFGQTLGFYGVGEGFHVVLPFLGPSNLRDIAGLATDSYVSALSTMGDSDLKYKIPNNFEEQIGIKTFDVINSTSLRLGQYESLKKDALDLYPFLRDIYTQARKKQIEE